MRRATARGRMLPQSLSTDPRYGRLSLKAQVLYPLLWVNADDQGRLPGDPDEIKYAACPSIRVIGIEDIPSLLQEMETQVMIKVYSTSKTEAIQMLDWWEVQKLQWAWPSLYPPPQGWQDKLRYKKGAKEVVTENWGSGESSPDLSPEHSPEGVPPLTTTEELGKQIRALLLTIPQTVDPLAEHEIIKNTLAKLGQQNGFLPKSEVTTEIGRIDLIWEEPPSGVAAAFEIDIYEPKTKSISKLQGLACPNVFIILRSNPLPFQWHQGVLLIGLGRARQTISPQIPVEETKIEKEEENRRGRRRGRGISPEHSGETSTPSPPILDRLKYCYESGWNKQTSPKISARFRDLAEELSAAGCPLNYIDEAFKEAAVMNKLSISYVRAMLLDWLGVPRAPPVG